MKRYVGVWALLLVLTAVEVLLAYRHTPPAMMLALLLGLSLAKAGAIVRWFMHMAEEGRRLAMVVLPAFFFVMLALLGILGDAGRAGSLGAR